MLLDYHMRELKYANWRRATVYSADLFQEGFAGDLMNKEEGARYRDLILAKGGSRPPIEYLEEYLGRKPDGVACAKAIAS